MIHDLLYRPLANGTQRLACSPHALARRAQLFMHPSECGLDGDDPEVATKFHSVLVAIYDLDDDGSISPAEYATDMSTHHGKSPAPAGRPRTDASAVSAKRHRQLQMNVPTLTAPVPRSRKTAVADSRGDIYISQGTDSSDWCLHGVRLDLTAHGCREPCACARGCREPCAVQPMPLRNGTNHHSTV